MIQGTTPMFQFNLPFDTNIVKSAEIVLEYVDANKKVQIVKTLDDCELEENRISTMLTQEETLALPAPAIALVQLRVKTGNDVVLATPIHKVNVKTLLRECVIE